jgi:hypothetical protein
MSNLLNRGRTIADYGPVLQRAAEDRLRYIEAFDCCIGWPRAHYEDDTTRHKAIRTRKEAQWSSCGTLEGRGTLPSRAPPQGHQCPQCPVCPYHAARPVTCRGHGEPTRGIVGHCALISEPLSSDPSQPRSACGRALRADTARHEVHTGRKEPRPANYGRTRLSLGRWGPLRCPRGLGDQSQ